MYLNATGSRYSSRSEMLLQTDVAQAVAGRRDFVSSAPEIIVNEDSKQNPTVFVDDGRFCLRVSNHSRLGQHIVHVCKSIAQIVWVYSWITICSFIFLAAPLGLNSVPDENNWWIYAFVQQLYQIGTALCFYISIYNASLPGMKMRYRVITHIFGMGTYCGYRLLCHILKKDADYTVNILAQIIPILTVTISYFMYAACFVGNEANTGLSVLDIYTGTYWLESKFDGGRIFRATIRQWALAFLFHIVGSAMYFIIMILAFAVQDSSTEATYILWFLTFCVVNYVLKGALKGVGILLDMGKGGTYSLFLFAEIASLNFYYIFYRAMFDTLDSYVLFLGLQSIHLFCEWVFYPLRATTWYYNFYRRRVSSAAKWKSKVLDALLAPLSAKLVFTKMDWCSFITLDYGIRVIIQTYTAIYFLAGFTFLRYGWNKNHFLMYSEKYEPQKDYELFAFYTGLSVLLEIINTTIVDRCFFKPRKLRMCPYIHRLFSNTTFVWGVIFLTAAQYADIWLINTVFKFSY